MSREIEVKFKTTRRYSEPHGWGRLTGIKVVFQRGLVYLFALNTKGDHHYRWLELAPEDAKALAKVLVKPKKKKHDKSTKSRKFV